MHCKASLHLDWTFVIYDRVRCGSTDERRFVTYMYSWNTKVMAF